MCRWGTDPFVRTEEKYDKRGCPATVARGGEAVKPALRLAVGGLQQGTSRETSDESLVEHRIGDLEETGDVRTDNVVAG